MNPQTKYQINNICIFGVGAVGGFFGAKIAHRLAQQKDTTTKVFFIGRGKHLEEIKKHGLILNTVEKQSITCKPTLATHDISEIPQPDLCLMCVKGYDLDGATKALREKTGDNTIIIPLLNGVDIYERIRKTLEAGIVLPACVYISMLVEKPGVVTHAAGPGLIICGKDPKFPEFDSRGVIDFFERMEVNFTWNDDPYPAIWEKYVFIAGYALVTAYTNKTFGEIISEHESKDLVSKVMEEIVSIARKKGVKLPEAIVADSVEKAGMFSYDTKTSFQRDIESKAKRNEGDLFGGTILRLGKELGVPTPVTESIYSKIEESIKR